MKLDSFNPSHDEIIFLNPRVMFGGGDIWKVDQNGIPHSFRTMYGDFQTIKLPDNFPMKYKGKKVRRAVIWCNSCETVTGVELFFTGGNVIAFDDPDSSTFRDVSDEHKQLYLRASRARG